MYTDELSFDDAVVMEVMRKAREIQLERVFAFCLKHCVESLSPTNAVERLVQASEFGLDELRAPVLAYLTKNIRSVRQVALETLHALPHELMLKLIMSS